MEHQLSRHDLHGGAKLLIINTVEAPAVHVEIGTLSGFRYGPAGKNELPHLAEHLMFEGNSAFKTGYELKASIEAIGAGRNATTSRDITTYWSNGRARDLNTLIDWTVPLTFRPLVPEDAVKEQIGTISSELTRNVDNDGVQSGYVLLNALQPKIYLPFARRIQDLQAISRQDILDYHSEHYGLQNARILIAGHFTEEQVSKIVDKLNEMLEGLPKGERRTIERSLADDYHRKAIVTDSTSEKLFHFALEFIEKEIADEDRAIMSRVAKILTGGLASRMQILGRKKGLTYGAGSGSGANEDFYGFSVADQTQPEKLLPLFELAMEQLADIAGGNVTDEEMTRTAGQTLGNVEMGLQTPSSLVGWYRYRWMRDQNLESPADWIEQVEAVTKADIKRVAKKYLRGDNWMLHLRGRGLETQKDTYVAVLDRHFPVAKA